MERSVRVTIAGPALAALCLSEWLQLQGPESTDGIPVTLPSGGTVEFPAETAEFWLELPSSLVYSIIASPAPETASVRRIAPEQVTPAAQPTHVATYLLRMEMPNPRRTSS